MGSKWGGRRAQEWTAAVLAEWGTSCWLQLPGCTQLATTGDHIYPRSTHPQLQYLVANGRPACASCNRKRQDTPHHVVIAAKRAADELDEAAFFEPPTQAEGPPSPVPPPDLR